MKVKVVTISKKITSVAVVIFILICWFKISDYLAGQRWKLEMFSPGLKGKTVVIDPGHGGADPGATAGGIREADINMKLAEALRQLLIQNGVKVRLTRTGNDGLVPKKVMSFDERRLILEKRKSYALRQRAHLLVSIHTNSSPDTRARGGNVFYGGDISMPLAEAVQSNLNRMSAYQRQASRSGFTVINGNAMPTVLIETGFISNKYDRDMLLHQQDKLAEAIYVGLQEYAGKLKPPQEKRRNTGD